jgi:hypothetical protein
MEKESKRERKKGKRNGKAWEKCLRVRRAGEDMLF